MQNQNQKLTSLALNSTAAFTLTYLAQYFIFQLVTIWVATALGFKAELYLNGANINPVDMTWYQYSKVHQGQHVFYIFTSGSIACLVVAIICKILYFNYFKRRPGLTKLYLEWAFLHGWIFFFGGLGVGTITYSGWGVGLSYLFWSSMAVKLLGLFGVFMVVVIGFLSTRNLLQMANSRHMISSEGMTRIYYIGAIAVIPALAGHLLVYLLRVPYNHIIDVYNQMAILLVLVPMVSYAKAVRNVIIPKDREHVQTRWRQVLAVPVVMVALKVLFAVIFPELQGIPFQPEEKEIEYRKLPGT